MILSPAGFTAISAPTLCDAVDGKLSPLKTLGMTERPWEAFVKGISGAGMSPNDPSSIRVGQRFSTGHNG